MNKLDSVFFNTRFEKEYLRSTAGAYEDLFCRILEKRYPDDFERTAVWGAVGDRKCDGYIRSDKTFFQVYAPRFLSAKDAIKKIEKDFTGALEYWEGAIRAWIFVHNDPEGLSPDVRSKLMELDSQYSDISVRSWGPERLRQEALSLSLRDLEDLFGPSPAQDVLRELESTSAAALHVRIIAEFRSDQVETEQLMCLRSSDGQDILSTLLKASQDTDDRPVLVVGEAGSGKSTLALSLAEVIAKSGDRLPVFVKLLPGPDDLGSLVRTEVSRLSGKDSTTFQAFAEIASPYKVVLILDGLDELLFGTTNENIVFRTKVAVLRLAESCPVILTSRSTFFLSPKNINDLFADRFHVLTISPLAISQVEAHLRSVHQERLVPLLKSDDDFRALASNPLLLNLIIKSVGGVVSRVPRTGVDIYRNAVDLSLTRDLGRRSILQIDQVKGILNSLAFFMFERKIASVTSDQLLMVAEESLGQLPEDQDQVLFDLRCCSLLTHGKNPGAFRFSHQSYFEFFLAQHLVSKIRLREPIEDGIVERIYFMLQVLLFSRKLLETEEEAVLRLAIEEARGPLRSLLIMVSRNAIERSRPLQDFLKDLLERYPYLEVAARIEAIYSIYRFQDLVTKKELARLLTSDPQGFLSTVRTQFGSKHEMVKWARQRITDPEYVEGREFLYFYPLMLCGDSSDISRISTFLNHSDPLVKSQARIAISVIEEGRSKDVRDW